SSLECGSASCRGLGAHVRAIIARPFVGCDPRWLCALLRAGRVAGPCWGLVVLGFARRAGVVLSHDLAVRPVGRGEEAEGYVARVDGGGCDGGCGFGCWCGCGLGWVAGGAELAERVYVVLDGGG